MISLHTSETDLIEDLIATEWVQEDGCLKRLERSWLTNMAVLNGMASSFPKFFPLSTFAPPNHSAFGFPLKNSSKPTYLSSVYIAD